MGNTNEQGVSTQPTTQDTHTTPAAPSAPSGNSKSKSKLHPVKTVNFVNIPQELKKNASFCVWKREKRSGRLTKVPYNPRTGALAKTNDPSTFADFATVMTTYAMGGWDGIGYRVSEGIGAIDIDHCIREDGSLNDVAASIMAFMPDAYFERSPSGAGLRGFFRLSPDFAYDKTVYYVNNRKHGLEVYLPGTTNRFVTVTGDMYRSGAVARNDEALQSVLDTFMKRTNRMVGKAIEPCSYLTDEEVIAHAGKSESGDKFTALMKGNWEEGYDSQSDADMALISILAFWCGNVEEQIDRIFRSSGLMRDKWDRMTGDATYGQITIRNAVSSGSAIYLPIADLNSAEADFNDLDEEDNEEEQHAAFSPDLTYLTLTLEEMKPHTNPRYQRDEIGIGNAFADYFKPIARFNADRGIWYVYDGKVWQPDENALAVAELAKRLADELYTFALQIKDEDTRNRYIKRVQKLQLRKHRKTMVEDAKSVYPVKMSLFDSSKYLFNCQNGTLDLNTLTFKSHDPKDFITKLSPVNYDAGVSCPRWNQFVDEVMQGKTAVGRYLQKAVGYSLTGDTSLECLFIMYGPTTRNGKTTTIETILRLMGEYGRSAKPDMLASNFRGPSNGAPSEDVARLAGARFVGISEMEQKLTINASLTKQLTGNNKITARYLHENSFEFSLQAKIFIDTNHLPNVTDQTLFESGRIKIIPFNRHFEEHEQDKSLKSTLTDDASLSGILNWAVEGYKLFKAEGLEEPEEVKSATAQYRQDSDRIAQFIDAWLEEGKDEDGDKYQVPCKAAYRVYAQWCEAMNYRPDNYKNFRAAMEKVFMVDTRRPKGGGNMTPLIIGVRLRKEEVGAEEEDADAFTPLADEGVVM